MGKTRGLFWGMVVASAFSFEISGPAVKMVPWIYRAGMQWICVEEISG